MRSSKAKSSSERRGQRASVDLANKTISRLENQNVAETLPLERAYHWEKVRPNRIFLTQPINGLAHHWSWAQTMNESRRIAAYLQTQQWAPASKIVILSKNCSWWIMAELAIWMAGHVTVPIYTSLPGGSARRLMEHCGAVACFIGPLDNPDLISSAIPDNLKRIRFPNAPSGMGVEWASLLGTHQPLRSKPVRSENELATIIYTSGTTGAPKGAMHRFGAFPYFAKAVVQVVGKGRRRRLLSYLPLAHIAERALTETTALYLGWRLFFCENQATFMTDLKRAQPGVFFSVPRLYTKFQQGILEKVSQRKLGKLLALPVIRYFVRKRILRGLGLNKVQFAASGSAPISLSLLLWFRQLGLPICEGYGTTEAGITHTAPLGESRPGYVGRNAPGVQTRIADNGEVLIKSSMAMLGYYRDSQATDEVFTANGFIRTGDLGELDSDGWLKITGRIKEQFKTTKGKYVSPGAIELMLADHAAIETCLVMGTGLPAPIAVAVLSGEAQQLAATESGREQLGRSFESLLDATNSSLAPHEQLQFLALVASKWSVESGLITPTLKLKRLALELQYSPFISGWASLGKRVVWRLDS